MMYDYCAGESVVARVRGMRGSPPQKSLRPIYVVSAHGSSVLHRDRRYADHGCPADFSKRLVWPLFKQLVRIYAPREGKRISERNIRGQILSSQSLGDPLRQREPRQVFFGGFGPLNRFWLTRFPALKDNRDLAWFVRLIEPIVGRVSPMC